MLLPWALCHNLPQLPLIPACVGLAVASTLRLIFWQYCAEHILINPRPDLG